jgi:hypothetical protein
MPNGRCNLHGGKSRKGGFSGTYQQGSRSKYLPKRLLERFEEAAKDQDLINMTQDLALIEARLADLLGRVDSGEAGQVWLNLRLAWQALRQAQSQEDQAGAAEALTEIGRMINRGAADALAWREVGDLIERRRRVVETEQKRRIAAGRLVAVEEAMAIVIAIQESVRTHVQDRATLQAISEEVSRLIPATQPGEPGLTA